MLRPVPAKAEDVPAIMEHVHDERGNNYVARWRTPVLFTDGARRRSMWFSAGLLGEPEAKRQAWEYFRGQYDRFGAEPGRRRREKKPRDMRGRLGPVEDDGRRFHGGPDHRFVVWSGFKEEGPRLRITSWDPRVDTFCAPADFCGHFVFQGRTRVGNEEFECLGHGGEAEAPLELPVMPEAPGPPVAAVPPAPVGAEVVAVGEGPAPVVDPAGPPPGAGVGDLLESEPGDGAQADADAAPDDPTFGDYWDPHPARGAWVRVHVAARRALFDPRGGAEGPDPATLSGVRVTHVQYSDGSADVVRDDWTEATEQACLLEPWVGETWFFHTGVSPEPTPFRKRMRAKGAPVLEVDEVAVMKKLRTGAGIDRTALVDSLSTAGVERQRIAAAQRICPELAVYYLACLAEENDRDPRAVVQRALRDDPSWAQGRKLDSVVENARKFELVGGLLFRRVYCATEGEVQLRCAVPTGFWGRFEAPGRGLRSLGFRERLLAEYHNGSLAGHQGRERTMDCLERDFWWPGMYSDVRRWCQACETCRGERGQSGVSAWTRTELYTSPFRVLQFDTITCDTAGAGSRYVLTVVCCFSRWAWLCPIRSRDAATVADVLLTRVFLGMAMFPVVLRSDNAAEFRAEVVQQMNKLLDIRHVTGSTYHPQSQGMVESMHKTLNQVVRGLVEEHPEHWERMLPFAECILRASPMAVLGGRCPYEIVTGMKPRFPIALGLRGEAQHVTVDDYAAGLREYFREAWRTVERAQLAAVEAREETLAGHLSAELHVGDTVLVKREPVHTREGPTRFQARVYDGVYRVVRKAGRHTFYVQDVADPRRELGFLQPLAAERLIKLDLPTLEISESQPRVLEMREGDYDVWVRWHVLRFAIDGRVQLKRSDSEEVRWMDLSRVSYRWVV